ncbi:MAG: DeoR/GlpR transcriptional regulator [Chloroflexi bacterium]|nr:MAG: DeoR/GlpR transcriptional regulator [Chloroflexota bacterium]
MPRQSPSKRQARKDQVVHPADRRHRILARVAAEQTIHVAELARELGVSEMTIRRDIRRLERDGFVRQTYGGATAHITRSFDVAFNARALQHSREKRLIGMRTTELMDGARVVYLGIGTTAEQFARYLPHHSEMTIVTASLPIASLLGTRPVRTVAIGGSVLRDELSCNGPAAIRALERYRFDLAVIGAAGLSARWGITELTDEEAEIQRTAIDRSDRLILMADGSKIGSATNAVVVGAERIDTLITDASASSAELDRLRELGIRVVFAGRPGLDARTEAQAAAGGSW